MKSIRNWIHGLVAAVVSGAANSITVAVVDPETFNIETGLDKMLTVAAVAAIMGAAAYLKQSPLPIKETKPK